MNKEPICVFETQEALEASLKEWQSRLFLDDWIVTARIVPQADIESDCSDAEIQQVRVLSCASIRILEASAYPENAIVRLCQEKTLVHELLHLKINWLDRDDPSLQEAYYDVCEHALLEQIAKSLIMAKYDIGFEWFRR